jgi:hypothetical protein
LSNEKLKYKTQAEAEHQLLRLVITTNGTSAVTGLKHRLKEKRKRRLHDAGKWQMAISRQNAVNSHD